MEMTATKTVALGMATVALMPLIGVRGAFAEPYTTLESASVNAVNRRIGDIKVTDAYVLVPGHGQPSLRLGVEELPNTPTDTLTGMQVATVSGPASPTGLPIRLAPGVLVNGAVAGSAGMPLPTTDERLPIPGADATVTLTFTNAGTVTLKVPVVARQP